MPVYNLQPSLGRYKLFTMESDTEALARSIELPDGCSEARESDDPRPTSVRGRASLSDFSRTATCYPLFFASGRTDRTATTSSSSSSGDPTGCDPSAAGPDGSPCFKRQRQGYFLVSFISLIVLAGLAMIFVGYYLHNRGYLLIVGIIYPWVVGVPTCYVYCQYRGSRTMGRRRGSTIALSSAMSIDIPPPQYECRHQFTSVDYTYTPQANNCPSRPSHHRNGSSASPTTNIAVNTTTDGRFSISISCDEPPPPYDEVTGQLQPR